STTKFNYRSNSDTKPCPVSDLIQLDDASLLPTQNISSDNIFSNLPQNDIEWFDNMEDRYNASTDEKWAELDKTLLYDYLKRKIIKIE
ncbi:26053_t:CDS:1, partial [Racocetra persica]